MDPSSHSVYLASSTLGAGYRAFNSNDCTGNALGPTDRSPDLQGTNGRKPCVDLDHLLAPKGAQDISGYRIASIMYIH